MNKKLLFSILIVIVAVLLILTFAEKDERLNAYEIEELRTQYPIYGDINKVNPLIEIGVVKTTLKELSQRADTFVYGEITEEVPVYSVYSYAKFYGYKLRVFKDAHRKIAQGEEIIIIANTEFKDYNPSLSVGMKVVVPVAENKSQQGKYNFDVCMYYVTEDGFVLSAFDEKEMLDKEYSGIKIEKFLNEIKKYPL